MMINLVPGGKQVVFMCPYGATRTYMLSNGNSCTCCASCSASHYLGLLTNMLRIIPDQFGLPSFAREPVSSQSPGDRAPPAKHVGASPCRHARPLPCWPERCCHSGDSSRERGKQSDPARAATNPASVTDCPTANYARQPWVGPGKSQT